jgi:hypothetical protein
MKSQKYFLVCKKSKKILLPEEAFTDYHLDLHQVRLPFRSYRSISFKEVPLEEFHIIKQEIEVSRIVTVYISLRAMIMQHTSHSSTTNQWMKK